MSEQQQESLKVYELAKELGLDSFTLLDKLKTLNIEVKSHMSSLGSDQANAVRDAIRGNNKRGAGATAGTAARKRVAAPAAGATAAAPATAAPAKKVVKKAAAADAPAAPAKKAESAAPAEAPKRKVIKRRSENEVEAAEPAHQEPEQETAYAAEVSVQEETATEAFETAPATHQDEEEEVAHAAASEEEDVQESEAAPLTAAPVSATEAKTATAATPAAKAAAPAATKAAAPAAKAPAAPVAPRRNLEEYTPRANAPGTKVIFRTPNNRPDKSGQKDELSEESSSRRLKIVAPPPPAASRAAPAPGPAGADHGPRPTYRTPGGPVGGVEARRRPSVGGAPGGDRPAAPGGDMFQPMTSYVSRDSGSSDDRNKRGGPGGNSPSTRGPTPEEVRINDFRKRELVFQPKRKRLPPGKQVKRTEITEMAAHKKKIRMDDKIVVSDLAQRMGEKATVVLSRLMKLGVMAGLNQTIDFDTAALISQEFGWEVTNTAFNEDEMLSTDAVAEEEGMVERPPVITVMGHVDHGKTSLLDTIRNAKVASGEAGGITQHIGAYSVIVNGKPITFLDTPGHEAFANMRSRGANLTDIVVLVVAADDSIMPQTKEAIAHAQKAGVPIIVAANKIDKPSANLEKVRKDLSINNVLVEEWGGQVPMLGVSALKNTGITELLEAIQLQAEVLELKANPNRAAEGVVLESRMEKGRGIVTDLLVDKGTLRTGDYMVVGVAYGRVRSMTNDSGQVIKEVLPGFPAEIIGLNDVPSAGDTFNVVKTENEAKAITESRRQKISDEKAAASAPKPMTMDELLARQPVAGVKELNLIIKADVFGSAEAIRESIEKITSAKVKAKVLSAGVGVVTENDVQMARTANAMILGFNAKPDNKARDLAKRDKVEIRHYTIIYQLLDDVRTAMEDLLEPIRRETPMGRADVKQVFTVSKLGTVAGSTVADGKISRNAFARVTRGKDTVAEGKVVSLRRFKDDVSETIKGQECGIGVENFEGYLAGDVINVFHVELVKQSL